MDRNHGFEPKVLEEEVSVKLPEPELVSPSA
jgi:hypothetical protein